MAETRIYLIEEKGAITGGYRLIEATSSSQAVRHCAQKTYQAKPATPKDIAKFMSCGVTIENAISGDVNTSNL